MNKNLFLTHVGSAGGAELKVIRICEGLDKDNLEFVTFQQGPLSETLKKHGIKSSVLPMPAALISFKKEDGVPAILKAIPAVFKMIFSLAKKCRQFDRVVCISQKSFILAALAKPLHRKPIAWFMNDLVSEEHFSKPLIFMLTKIFRYAPDHIIVNSEASKQAWLEAGGKPGNVHIIYPGNDIAAIDKQLQDQATIDTYRARFSPEGQSVIGIFGRLSAWKGQDVFIKALAKLDGVMGVIVGGALFGEEAYADELQQLAVDLGVNDRLIFVGHIDDIVKAMAACDIVLHCSTAPEPFGSVITEAQLTETPVIVSKAGGAQEIIIDRETGILTTPGDVNALVEAVKEILNTPQKAKDMALKGRKRVLTKYSANKMIEDFKAILK